MSVLKRRALCAFYRWEFIRRSEFYKADVNRIFEVFGDWLHDRDVDMEKFPQCTPRVWAVEIEPKLLADPESAEFYMNKMGPFLIALKMKWGTFIPLHWSYTFDPTTWDATDALPTDFVLDEDVDLKVGLDHLLSVAVPRMQMAVTTRVNEFLREETERRFGVVLHFPNFISSECIDLTLAERGWKDVKNAFERETEILKSSGLIDLLNLSPEDEQAAFELIRHIVRLLDGGKREIILWPIDPVLGRAAHHAEFNRLMDRIDWPKKGKNRLIGLLDERSRDSKIHLEKLKEYLEIWDRKHHVPHPTNTEIARQLFPTDYNDGQAGAINARVQRGYKHAQAFIDGRFRQIK
jgi:hypothetical protein